MSIINNHRGEYQGLVNASTIFLSSVIGVACASGFYFGAVITTLITVGAMFILKTTERNMISRGYVLNVIVDSRNPVLKRLLEILDSHKLGVSKMDSKIVLFERNECVKIKVEFIRSTNKGEIPEFKDEPTFTKVIRESNKWAEIVEAKTISDINEKTESLKIIDFINMCESRHNDMLCELGDMIKKNIDTIRLITIAGPSSSGKTTFSNRLRVALLNRGIKPIRISIDNYYLERKYCPLDEDGNYDTPIGETKPFYLRTKDTDQNEIEKPIYFEDIYQDNKTKQVVEDGQFVMLNNKNIGGTYINSQTSQADAIIISLGQYIYYNDEVTTTLASGAGADVAYSQITKLTVSLTHNGNAVSDLTYRNITTTDGNIPFFDFMYMITEDGVKDIEGLIMF